MGPGEPSVGAEERAVRRSLVWASQASLCGASGTARSTWWSLAGRGITFTPMELTSHAAMHEAEKQGEGRGRAARGVLTLQGSSSGARGCSRQGDAD